MPATEPDEPELPLWPEPGTRHGGSASPSSAREAGAAGPTPPANVPPAVHDRPGLAPRPVPSAAEPSRWDDRARRRLIALGTPWDKRLTFEQWLELARALADRVESFDCAVGIADPRALLARRPTIAPG